MTTRATREEEWEPPVRLGSPVNTSSHDAAPSIATDGSTLYFVSARPGGIGGDSDFWHVPIVPVVDFNGDGKVDGREVLILTEHWGQNDRLCDIGPFAWGDATVDVQDVIALAEYIGKKVYDPTLIAHWALDEAEGTLAYDSVGTKDGMLLGNPVWRPDDGMVNGALEFDGVDDCIVVSGRVLDPADGPFSVLAWIKGGAPGQVLISQTDGENWLMADALEGTLATCLTPPVRRTPIPPLVSGTVITDGNWHWIALVWDDTSRTLYVDDVLVAEDIQNAPAGCSGDLNLGCGKGMAPESFFRGLIDDVRIYNRAAKP